MEYKNNKILVKNPDIDDIIELPNLGRNDQYMFIGDFIKNYLQNEEIETQLAKGNLILETCIPGEDEYFNKQVLYVNAETKNPDKMEILDIKGKNRFTVSYKDFKKGKLIIIPGMKNKLLVIGNKLLPRRISRKIILKTNKK